jgi:hypothetical protein
VRGRVPLPWTVPLALTAPLLTAAGETLYFWLAYGAPPMRVVEANFSLQTGIRPAVIVFALAAAVSLVGAVRNWASSPKPRPRYA